MTNDNLHKGFKPLWKEVAYNNWNVRYVGYDYSKTLMKKSLSNYLFQNEHLSGFIEHINAFMVKMVDNVKYIRNFFNYAVPKDYKKIN